MLDRRDPFTGYVIGLHVPEEPEPLTPAQATAVDAMWDAKMDAYLRSELDARIATLVEAKLAKLLTTSATRTHGWGIPR